MMSPVQCLPVICQSLNFFRSCGKERNRDVQRSVEIRYRMYVTHGTNDNLHAQCLSKSDINIHFVICLKTCVPYKKEARLYINIYLTFYMFLYGFWFWTLFWRLWRSNLLSLLRSALIFLLCSFDNLTSKSLLMGGFCFCSCAMDKMLCLVSHVLNTENNHI